MSEVKVARKHKVIDIPVLGPLIAGGFAFFLSELVFGAFGYVPGVLLGCEDVISHLCAAIGGLIVMMIYRKWFQGQFKGTFRMKTCDRKSMWIIAGVCLFDLVYTASSIFTNGAPNFTMNALGIALMAGICEEVCFRLIPMSGAMRKVDSKKATIIAMSISVMVFGLVHCLNLFHGQSVIATITQIIFAAGFGVFCGAVYLRTGNILITMALHCLHDFLVIIQYNPATASVMQEQSLTELVGTTILGLVFVIGGILLLVGHQSDIEKVWKECWSK